MLIWFFSRVSRWAVVEGFEVCLTLLLKTPVEDQPTNEDKVDSPTSAVSKKRVG
jgi:hypothetical protein